MALALNGFSQKEAAVVARVAKIAQGSVGNARANTGANAVAYAVASTYKQAAGRAPRAPRR